MGVFDDDRKERELLKRTQGGISDEKKNKRNKDFDYLLPDPDEDNWRIVKFKDVNVDKKKFILDRFMDDYPNVPVEEYEQVMELVSRTKIIKQWYFGVKLELIDECSLPAYFRGKVDSEKYNKALEIVREINLNNKNCNDEKILINKQYREEIAEIDKKYNDKNDLLINKDKLVRISTLSSELLPLSIQLAITKHTPKEDASLDRDDYAREVLLAYKIDLYEKISEDPDFDIETYIDENAVK